MENKIFIYGLENNNIDLIRSAPKSDLHNHGELSGSHISFERGIGKKIEKLPDFFSTF